MSIEKSLYAAPVGLEEVLNNDEPDIEITIEDPESVEIGIDGMPILRIDKDDEEEGFDENLAEEMDDGALASLAGDLIGDYDADVGSRKDWMQTYVDGLELLGMQIEERAEPWEGAARSSICIPNSSKTSTYVCIQSLRDPTSAS